MTSTPAKGKRCTENSKKCANAIPVKSLRVRGLSVQDANSPGKNRFSHQHGSELSTSVPAIGTFRFFHRDVSVGAVKKPPEKKTEPPGRTRKSPQHKQVGHSDSSGAHLALRCVQEHEPNTLTEQCCR